MRTTYLLCAILLGLSSGCVSGQPSTYSSISVSDNGASIATVKHSASGSVVLVLHRGAVTELPVQGVPIGVAFSHAPDRVVVSVADPQLKGQPNWRRLLEYSLATNAVTQEIASSSVALSSAIPDDDAGFIYLKGVTRTKSSRPSSIWVRQQKDGTVTSLSDTEYGYRFSPSLVRSTLIFLYVDEEASTARAALTSLPTSSSAQLPSWIPAAITRDTEAFGCDRRGTVCYRTDRYGARHGGFAHRLHVITADRTCHLPLRYDWVETVSISRSGTTISAVVRQGPRSRTAANQARVVTFRQSADLCNPAMTEYSLNE